MPRFILLYHDCPPDYRRSPHWDLMLEVGDTLQTWALAQLPRAWSVWRSRTADAYPDCPPLADGDAVEAERLADHRLDYLDKEGPLGGGRGTVMRIDRGTYERVAAAHGELLVALSDALWEGSIRLRQAAADATRWRLTAIRPTG